MLDFLKSYDAVELYRTVAYASTALFVLKLTIFSFLDLGEDVELDDCGNDSFNFFSLQSILSFLMGFGWAGCIGVDIFQHGITTFLVAFAVGGMFMGFSVWLMFQAKKLNKVIDTSLEQAVGKTG